MLVYRATDPEEQEWRIEIDDPPNVRVRVFQVDGRTVAGTGERMDGMGALGSWLVARGMTEADLTQS